MIQLQYLGALSEYNTIRLKYGHKFNIIVLGQPYCVGCRALVKVDCKRAVRTGL